jgi:hypothetical protein
MKEQFFKHAPEEPTVSGKQAFAPARYFDMFFSIATESFYVLDIPQKQFCYVKPDDLFLCGFPSGKY